MKKSQTRVQQQTAAVQASEARVSAILNNMIDGVITIDEQGIIESVNRAVETIFGYSPAEVIGKNINMLMPEPYCSEHDGYLQNYLETGQRKIIGIGRQVVGQRKDGSLFPLDLAVSEMFLGDKRMFSGLVRDISARVAVETQLKSTLTLQQAILDSANYTIISTTPDGIIQTFNAAAERMLGYTTAEVVGKVTPSIIHDPEEVARRAAVLSDELGESVAVGFEAFVAKARRGVVDENEWTYIRKDGQRFPVLLSLTSLRNEQGEITGYLGIGTDITERKKMDRMKSEFISTVSHELRTPLTSIRGSLGLIVGGAMGEMPAKAKPLLEIANKNSERLVRLINDILDIEKIEAGKMVFEIQPLSLAELVEQTIEANKGFAEQLKINLLFHNQTPNVMVEADHDRLVQVLTNLISNACKFSPQGEAVEVISAFSDGWVWVSVADHGAGIPDEFKQRIFQKFAQADSSNTRQKGGTGLGLSITKAIVERLGGRIGFDTELGVGTTFYFKLRVWQAQPVEIEIDDTTVSPTHRILICEDDRDVATLLGLFLKQAGYATDTAYTVKEARSLLQQNHYDAMTLDLMLPDEDGLSFLHELRNSHESYANLPVTIVSAKAELEHQQIEGEAVEVWDWISKPINKERLIKALDQAVTHRTGGQPRILHVEDDDSLQEVVATILDKHADIVTAPSLQAARTQLAQTHFDLVLLDVGLPDGSGLALLPELKNYKPPIPVVVFSAQELTRDIAQQVKATLVKSQTSNEALLETIFTAINNLKGKGERGKEKGERNY